MTRRALLGAGAAGVAALAAGCGDRAEPPPPRGQTLGRLLDAELALLAAYRAVSAAASDELAPLAAAAGRRAAALRAAGAPRRPEPPAPAAGGTGDVLAREHAALNAYVAALPGLAGPALRRLGANGVAGTARAEALLREALGRQPAAAAFPGQGS